MTLRLLMSVALLVALAGCSTTKRTMPNTSHLQLRISSIEDQLDVQSQDIGDLKVSVNDLANSVKHMTALKQKQAISPAKAVTKTSSPKATRTQYQNILRVPVAPKEVQSALKEAGYYQGAIDGKLGPQSEKAIREFQTDHDLASDGIIGKKTWAELKTYLD